MSETPQQRVSRWLNDPLVDLADTEIREAIRAVLAENASVSRAAGYLSDLATWWVAKAEQAEAERDALRLACNVSAADLIEAGRLCWITDDEYPLCAVERVVAERDTLTEKLSLVTEDYITHRNALERAEAALRAIADPREHPCDGVILRAIAVRGLEGGSRELRTRVQAGGPCPFVTRRSPLPALRTLLDKLERVEASEAYRSVWIVAQVHAGPYHGENWAVERAAARAALIDAPPREEK